MWPYSRDREGGDEQLAVVGPMGDLHIYNVHEHGGILSCKCIQIHSQQDILQSLGSGSPLLNRCQLLSYHGDTVTIQHKTNFFNIKLRSPGVETVKGFSIPSASVMVRQLAGLLFCVDPGGKLYIYIIETGTPVAKINFQSVIPAEAGIVVTGLTISASLSQVALITNTQSIVLIDLELYFSQYPSALNCRSSDLPTHVRDHIELLLSQQCHKDEIEVIPSWLKSLLKEGISLDARDKEPARKLQLPSWTRKWMCGRDGLHFVGDCLLVELTDASREQSALLCVDMLHDTLLWQDQRFKEKVLTISDLAESEVYLVHKSRLFLINEESCRWETQTAFSPDKPLQQLEAALINHDLEDVVVKLRTSETLYGKPDASMKRISTVNPEDKEQVYQTVEILMDHIQDLTDEAEEAEFAEHLLSATLDFLHRAVQNATSVLQQARASGGSTPESEEDISGFLSRMTDYRIDLANSQKAKTAISQSVPKSPLVRSGSQLSLSLATGANPSVQSISMSREQRTVIRMWDTMPIRAVVEDGLLNDEMALLQSYLERREGSDVADFQYLVSLALSQAVNLLHEGNVQTACAIFSKIGFNAISKLRQVCFYTPDRQLRNTIIKHLKEQEAFDKEEETLISYVHTLESLYSCPSFGMAKEIRSEGKQEWKVNEVLLDLLGDSGVSLACEEVANTETENTETANYAQIVLEWVRDWDEDTKQRVLLDQLIGRKDTSLSSSITTEVLYSYLVAHLDIKRLKEWIAASYPEEHERKTRHWPYNQQFPYQLFQRGSLPDFMMEELELELIRRGVFSQDEVRNFPAFLSKLAKAQAVTRGADLIKKHPSLHCMEPVEFHRCMIKYCIDQHLPELLCYYLDYWSLCVSSTNLEDMSGDTPGWVDMMLHFRQAAVDLLDPEVVFEASLASSMCLHQMSQRTVANMVEEDHVLEALASLMYLPGAVDQIAKGAIIDGRIGDLYKADVKEKLLAFPRVYKALFEPDTGQHQEQDISVYQLLQGDCPFDIGHLFGWQKTNSFANKDTPCEMPHFARSTLVERFGHRETLDFVYYLQQARPSYAFLSFVLAMYEGGVSSPSKRRIKHASSKAHLIGLKSFYNPAVTAACIGFCEMLGTESIGLRILVQTGNCIMAHKLADSNLPNIEKRRELETLCHRQIASQLFACYQNKVRALKITLAELEAAIIWTVDRKKIARCSIEASEAWHIALLFCHHYKLPYSNVYLKHCAQQDDWIAFILFAQTQQYPKDQLLPLLRHFPSVNLQEHLRYAIENVGCIDQTKLEVVKKKPKRDVRKKLYDKIGVSSEVNTPDKSGGHESEGSSLGTLSEATSSFGVSDDTVFERQEIILEPELVGQDLFSLLFACQSTWCPWRHLCGYSVLLGNPILSVLAACYEEADIFHCLCCWLYASLVAVPDSRLQHLASCDVGHHSWSVDDLSNMAASCSQNRSLLILLRAFQLFVPDHMLIKFLEFCEALDHHEPEDLVKDYLNEFKAILHQQRSGTPSPDREGSLVEQLGVTWVEEVVRDMLVDRLTQPRSLTLTSQLLQLLDHSNLTRLFHVPVPDFGKLHRLHRIATACDIQLDYNRLCEGGTLLEAECQRCLRLLQDGKHYNEARVFAEVAGLPDSTSITIKELDKEHDELRQTKDWNSLAEREAFWKKCNEVLHRHRISAKAASDYFLKKAEGSEMAAEKACIYKQAYDWLGQMDSAGHQRDAVYINMWKNNIQAKIQEREACGKQTSCLEGKALPDKVGLLHCGAILSEGDNRSQNRVKLEPEEQEALKAIIASLLNVGGVKESCKLAHTFDIYSQDLEIILTCIHLAVQVKQPSGLKGAMRKLLTADVPKREQRLSMRLDSMPRLASIASIRSLPLPDDWDQGEDGLDEVQQVMEKLQQHCTLAKPCCQRVLTLYSVARMLGSSYETVCTDAHFDLLSALLVSPAPGRFAVAKQYIQDCKLHDLEVAGYLAETVLKLLQNIHVQDTQSSVGRLKVQHKLHSDLMTLCRDPSALGSCLLDQSKSAKLHALDSHTRLAVEVDLLVYAHDCFTRACNMEGIARVLQACQSCTTALSHAEEYQLMVKLLTEVGRYGEMPYIFDILKQQHQFQLLMKPGADKKSQLCVAVLDYLRRYHSDDIDTYTMACIKFEMYREIAQLLEAQAVNKVKELKGTHLESNQETQNMLQSALRSYLDAAENYERDQCLRHADSCVKQARLIALQLQVLPSHNKLVNLDKAEAKKTFVMHPKMWEAYIICEAYKLHGEWVAALYQNVVISGETKYLLDYQRHLPLDTSIIGEIVSRYKAEKKKPAHSDANMKRLLNCNRDIVSTYKWAMELGLTTYAEEKLQGDNGAYLRDQLSR